MKVSFAGNNQSNNVFVDTFPSQKNKNYYYINKTPKIDTVELHPIKDRIKNNKKLMLGIAVVGAAILGALIFKKNVQGIVKSVNSSAVDETYKAKGITEEMINNAKDFLIKDVQATGEATANGICFYGPDSLGKEYAISSFLDCLEKSGYKIEHAPRIANTTKGELAGSIDNLMKKAENRFNKTNVRSVIVVRDLDKIAAERRMTNGESAGVVSALLKTQGCRKRGFAWISEAVDVSQVDPAVTRMGRMEHKIPIMPLESESVSVWKQYIELISRFKEGTKKDTLLKEAQEILSKKGI